jgi:hypothetical protein
MSKLIRDFILSKYKRKNIIIELNNIQKKIINDLRNNGYCTCHYDDIFGEGSFMKEVYPHSKKIKNKLENKLINDNTVFRSDKKFVARYYSNNSIIKIKSILNNLSVTDFFWDIAYKYLGSIPKITNLDYWLNIPTNIKKPTSSQLWHKDYEDLSLLKVFIYLEDVDENSGPFSYVSASHETGPNSNLFKRNYPNGIVLKDEEVNKHFSSDKILRFKVPKGTLVFVDTSGIHRGGFCTKSNRFLFTFTYTSFAGISPRNFKLDQNEISNLSAEKEISLIN